MSTASDQREYNMLVSMGDKMTSNAKICQSVNQSVYVYHFKIVIFLDAGLSYVFLCIPDLLDYRQLNVDTNHFCHAADDVAFIGKTVMALLSLNEHSTYKNQIT